MTNSLNSLPIEHVPIPIDSNTYHHMIAEIAELIYRCACEAEKNQR